MRKKYSLGILLSILLIITSGFAQNYNPVIDTVHVAQVAGTFLVDIRYTVSDTVSGGDNDTLIVYCHVSNDSGKTFVVPARTFTGEYGFNIQPGINKHITWDAGKDFPEQFGTKFRVKLTASDLNLSKIVTVKADTFSMGDSESWPDQYPQHIVDLNEFDIAPFAVTNSEYKIFCDMTNRSYPLEGGANQPPLGHFLNYPNNPVVMVSWFDAVRYCNWLSVQKGFSACYDTANWSFDPSKNGFHLPTEAQWERAARGNLARKTYPWGNDSPGNRCNYRDYDGDLVSSMPNFLNGRGTVPVGKFSTNGLGLYDMAGNVFEWCNDWYSNNYYENQTSGQNPYGPTSGINRVVRAGSWNQIAFHIRCATWNSLAPSTKNYETGFRIAR
ncbi:MAG TPA: SUMF1/EgtB/PvdO family nonheme iron enzyme [bacterium]